MSNKVEAMDEAPFKGEIESDDGIARLKWDEPEDKSVSDTSAKAPSAPPMPEHSPKTPKGTTSHKTDVAKSPPAETKKTSPDSEGKDKAAEAAPREQRPEDIPLWLRNSRPDKGFARKRWEFYVNRKSYLKPNSAVPDFWAPYAPRIAENNAFLYENSDYTMGIIVTIAVKGGAGKTTTTTWDAAKDSESTNGLTLLIDLDSTGTKSAAERLGIASSVKGKTPDTPSVAHKILDLGWKPTAEEAIAFFPKHKGSRVCSLAMDTSNLSRAETTRLLLALKPAFHSVFADTTPGLKETNTYGAVDAATLVVISTIYDNTSNDNGVKQTLKTKGYGLRRRIKEGNDVIVAIHGVEDKDFNPRYQEEKANEYGLKPYQISLFPMEQYAYKSRPVDPSMVSERYLFAQSEHRRRCAEACMRWNAKYPMKALPGDDPKADKLAAQAAKRLAAQEREKVQRMIERAAEKRAQEIIGEMRSILGSPTAADKELDSHTAADTEGDTSVTLEGSAK